MNALRIFSAGLCAGLLIGWLWGFLEGDGHLVVYLVKILGKTGSLPPFGFLDILGIPIMAGALYSLVLAPIGGVLSLVLAPVLSRLPGRLALRAPWEIAGTVCLTGVLFFSLYWWTRPILFYGLRFYDPKRLAASCVFLAVSLTAAVWAVKVLSKRMRNRSVKPGIPLIFLAFVWVLALLFFVRERSVALGDAPREGSRGKPNVVLVVPDALRADHLGCYGYRLSDHYGAGFEGRSISPNVDRLASEGVLFEKAVTQAPYTWTSFGSFLTGKFPRKHGLLKMDPTSRLDPKDNVTLAEILKGQGYVCGAFLMGTLSNNSGLLQGFDVYFEALVGHDPVYIRSKWSIFKSDLVVMRLYNKIKQALDPALVNTLACDFVRTMKNRPFFLLVHYYATHTPYDPPEPYKSLYDPGYERDFQVFTQSHNFAVMQKRIEMSGADLRHIKALYDGGVSFVDAMVGDLAAALEEAGVLDDTLLIFISDHGEELYDHKVFEHDWMFDTNLLVPLVIRFPGRVFAGARITSPVGLIDLVPTVADVAGFDLPEEAAGEVDGVSLLRLLGRAPRPPDGSVYVFGENNRYIAVKDGRFKLIRNRATGFDRFFDLESDPGETENVKDRFPDEHARLAGILEEFDRSMPVQTKTYEADPELYKRLYELGYIQGNIGYEEELEEELEENEK